MSHEEAALEPGAWVDERSLGRMVAGRFGEGAERVEIELVRLLAREGLGELHRQERFRPDGKRVGPDLKVTLETATLVLEVLTAARLAGLRVLARHAEGMPLRHVGIDDVLELLLGAGSDPPLP